MSKSQRQTRLEAALVEYNDDRSKIMNLPDSGLRTKMLAIADERIPMIQEQIDLEEKARVAKMKVDALPDEEKADSFISRMRAELDDDEWAAYKAEPKEGKQLIRRFLRKHI